MLVAEKAKRLALFCLRFYLRFFDKPSSLSTLFLVLVLRDHYSVLLSRGVFPTKMSFVSSFKEVVHQHPLPCFFTGFLEFGVETLYQEGICYTSSNLDSKQHEQIPAS